MTKHVDDGVKDEHEAFERIFIPPKQSDTLEAYRGLALEALPEAFGVVESNEMAETRKLIIAMQGNNDSGIELSETVIAIIAEYQRCGEALIEAKQGDAYTLAQLGLIIATGIVRRDAGYIEAAYADLESASSYADNLRLGAELIDVIEVELFKLQEAREKLWAKGVADVLRSLSGGHGLFGFDEETCSEISDMPFDEAVGVAYGYLSQAGLDPEDLLASFLER